MAGHNDSFLIIGHYYFVMTGNNDSFVMSDYNDSFVTIGHNDIL